MEEKENGVLIGSVAQTPVKVKTPSPGPSVLPKLEAIWLEKMNSDPWGGISGLISPKHLKLFPDSSKCSEPEG